MKRFKIQHKTLRVYSSVSLMILMDLSKTEMGRTIQL